MNNLHNSSSYCFFLHHYIVSYYESQMNIWSTSYYERCATICDWYISSLFTPASTNRFGRCACCFIREKTNIRFSFFLSALARLYLSEKFLSMIVPSRVPYKLTAVLYINGPRTKLRNRLNGNQTGCLNQPRYFLFHQHWVIHMI